jgi:hypothetical protein
MPDPKKKEEPSTVEPEKQKITQLPEPDPKLKNYFQGSQDSTKRENHVILLEE